MMETQDIYLEDYDWNVRIFYNVDRDSAYKVIDFLEDMDYNYPVIKQIEESLFFFEYDMGITTINKASKHATIVMTSHSSPSEMFNTMIHELKHLVDFVGVIEGIYLTGEELAYMIGDIGALLFPVAGKYLCAN